MLTVEKYMQGFKNLTPEERVLVEHSIQDYLSKSNLIKASYFRGYDEALKDIKQDTPVVKYQLW